MTAKEFAVLRGQQMRDSAIQAGYTVVEATDLSMAFALPLTGLSPVEGPSDRHTALGFRDAQAKQIYIYGTCN